MNPPYDARNVRDVTMETLNFSRVLGKKIKYKGVKACFVLSGDTSIFFHSVICKLIYYEDKSQVWKNSRALRKKVNLMNQKFIILKEILPKADTEIKATAVRMGLEMVTNNSIVSSAVRGENGTKMRIKVNSLADFKKNGANCDRSESLLRLTTAAVVQLIESHQRGKNGKDRRLKAYTAYVDTI